MMKIFSVGDKKVGAVGLQVHERQNYFSKKDDNDQETIQSSTTPDPGYHMEK